MTLAKSLGTDRRSGSHPPLLVSRAQRWLRRDRKTAGNPLIGVPAWHREAERDTTGNIAVSTVYIRGLEVWCKERRWGATLALIRRGNLRSD